MTLSETEKNILLDFQRARFAYYAFMSVQKANDVYLQARKDLSLIREPSIAALVRKMRIKSSVPPTSEAGRKQAVKEIDDAVAAEKELYELSFQFGDNIPHVGMIQ